MKAVGLDIGTAFIASAKYGKGDNITARYVRDGFFKMKAVDQREEMLKMSKISYVKKDKDLYVIGNEAFDMAVLFSQDLRRPLADGVISSKELETEFILKEILRRVAGDGEKGDVAYYSIPANPVDRDFNNIYHKEMFRRFLESFGYTAYPLNEAMAVAYSELSDYDFTGLSCSFGAGQTNVAMAYKGMEIFSFSVARCGDWIDKQVAQVRGIPTSDVAAEKEKKDFDLLNPNDETEQAIQIYYKAMLGYVVENIVSATEKHRNKIKLKDRLPFVVAGGTSMPKGFLHMLARVLKENPLPIPVGKVWQAKNPIMSVCKGCLIAAQKELKDDNYDGVTDISEGDNAKHQYPQKDKNKNKPVEDKAQDKSEKDLREDKVKSAVMSQGLEESIDLGDF